MRLKPAQAVRIPVGPCGSPLSTLGVMLSGTLLEYSGLVLWGVISYWGYWLRGVSFYSQDGLHQTNIVLRLFFFWGGEVLSWINRERLIHFSRKTGCTKILQVTIKQTWSRTIIFIKRPNNMCSRHLRGWLFSFPSHLPWALDLVPLYLSFLRYQIGASTTNEEGLSWGTDEYRLAESALVTEQPLHQSLVSILGVKDLSTVGTIRSQDLKKTLYYVNVTYKIRETSVINSHVPIIIHSNNSQLSALLVYGSPLF